MLQRLLEADRRAVRVVGKVPAALADNGLLVEALRARLRAAGVDAGDAARA